MAMWKGRSYTADGKRLVKIGVNYDSTQRTIVDWIISEN